VITDVFSKRNRTPSGEPLVRDVLPQVFRVQVAHIMLRALGDNDEGERLGQGGIGTREVPYLWGYIHDRLAEEHGLFRLAERSGGRRADCIRYLCDVKDVDKALDVIELSFRTAQEVVPRVPHYLWFSLEITQKPEDAVSDLNARFGEHNLGYRYVDGQIVRLDSEYLHQEVSEPALQLLHAHGFDGPEEEFRSAHEHFRHGRLKEAVVDALKAFESVMKAICDAQKWVYSAKATASELITVVLKEGLIPEYLQTEIAGLRNLLEASVPVVRNKGAGHGQGATSKPMPAHLAAYALHSAASNIVLLIQAHQALKLADRQARRGHRMAPPIP